MPDRPTRAERHAATLRRIVDAAWRLSAEHGLAGWTMRDLGGAVGMRAPCASIISLRYAAPGPSDRRTAATSELLTIAPVGT